MEFKFCAILCNVACTVVKLPLYLKPASKLGSSMNDGFLYFPKGENRATYAVYVYLIYVLVLYNKNCPCKYFRVSNQHLKADNPLRK